MRFIRVLAVALGWGVLLLPGAAAATAPPPGYVGIVIGDRYGCVRWHAGITGDDVLHKAADVTYRSDGIVLTINDEPDPPHADDTHFWSYWHDTGGQWHYSSVGASGYQPAAGTVEGWSYDEGQTEPPPPASTPAGLYAAICGARDRPPPAPKPTRTHTHRSSTHLVTSPTHASAPAHARTTTSTMPGSPTPVTHLAAETATAPTAAKPAHRQHRTERPATPTPAPSESTQPKLFPAAQTLKPLPDPADEADAHDGSPVPLMIGIGAVVVIAAGGVWTTLRRRRAS